MWPWDMTFESNRQLFMNRLEQHFGNTAAYTVSKFADEEYPLLLIVTKANSGLKVCTVLHANTSMDELIVRLIKGYELFRLQSNSEKTNTDNTIFDTELLSLPYELLIQVYQLCNVPDLINFACTSKSSYSSVLHTLNKL